MSSSTFDRVRPRLVSEPSTVGIDVQGKSALYSSEPVSPTFGSVVITCSDCHAASRTSYLRAAQLAVPSLHLIGLRRDHPSWMRCPSCNGRHWVNVRFR